MKYFNYKTCASVLSQAGENIFAFYDFSSGNGDVIYNQIYSPAQHSNASGIIADVLPGLILGKSNLISSNGGYFSGSDLVRVGVDLPFEGDWSAILDVSPDLCSYSVENNMSRVLFSSMDNIFSTSGFHVGINQSNRLYLQYNSGEKNTALNSEENNPTVNVTLLPEINKNCIITISQNKEYLSVGSYNLNTLTLNSQFLSTRENFKNSNSFYLGGFPHSGSGYWGVKANNEYTGYQGYVNNVALYSGQLDKSQTSIRCNCFFSTGSTTNLDFYTITSPTVTGYKETPIYDTEITGYVPYIENLIDNDGSSISVYRLSGLTGQVLVGSTVTYLSGETFIGEEVVSSTGILYDNEKFLLYNKYFLNFRDGLSSGENLELLHFKSPRFDNNIKPDLINGNQVSSDLIRLYQYGTYAQSNEDVSINSQEGHQPDFYINKQNLTLSGFEIAEHNLVYDTVSRPAICVDWSGLWSRGAVNVAKIPYFPYTPVWFPSGPQFIQTGNSIITITGIAVSSGLLSGQNLSGQELTENVELYLNGQKLTHDVDYVTGVYSDVPALHIDSSNLPDFRYSGLQFNQGADQYDVVGIETSELCFVPILSGEKPTRILKKITSNLNGISEPLSGYSEMIWVNGIRQEREVNYKKGLECSLTNSFTFFENKPFLFYNNDADYLNLG